MREPSKRVNLGRHKRYCKICSHEKREEIEQDFVAWKSPIAIAEEYGLSKGTAQRTLAQHAALQSTESDSARENRLC